MDLVPRLLDYVANFPRTEDASELKSQLSGCTYTDLRAACHLLRLPVSKKNSKKSGYIATLVSYWRGDVATTAAPPNDMSPPKPHLPHHPMPVHEASDVINYVHQFAPTGDVNELRDQLNGCKAVILRSACVQLDLRPNRKKFAKPNFVHLLIDYWHQIVAPALVTPLVTMEPEGARDRGSDDVEQRAHKRPRAEERGPQTKRASEERSAGGRATTVLTASVEKAQVVKEWAAAIEILSRVDGSAESIASIRALIENVVASASADL